MKKVLLLLFVVLSVSACKDKEPSILGHWTLTGIEYEPIILGTELTINVKDYDPETGRIAINNGTIHAVVVRYSKTELELNPYAFNNEYQQTHFYSR